MGEEAEYIDGHYDDYLFYNSEFETGFADKSKPKNAKGEYKCTLCKQFKAKDFYYKDKRNKSGIRSKCISCYNKTR